MGLRLGYVPSIQRAGYSGATASVAISNGLYGYLHIPECVDNRLDVHRSTCYLQFPETVDNRGHAR